MAEKLMTPAANADGTYLPMPWNGGRRIEKERLLYKDHQRLHSERFPDYAAGWRRPGQTTTSHVWELVGQTATHVASRALSCAEKQALVIVLDAAIQAGQDGRLLTHNLFFDAVAAAWSDHYRAARERGPARVSWEMSVDTLKGTWRDLLRNDIYLDKLIPVAQNGCGLYTVTKGDDDKYTVKPFKPTDATREQREKFLEIIASDESMGGTYRRRSSRRRLRLADARETDDTLIDEQPVDDDLSIEDATTRKVVEAPVSAALRVPRFQATREGDLHEPCRAPTRRP